MARNGKGEAPQRSCLGCRAVREQDQLIRFVLSPEGEVFPDLDFRLSGRGAYTCLHQSCLSAAVARRQFGRSFSQEVTVMPPEAMVAHVAQLMSERITGMIGLANKAGKVIAGGSMVSDALRSRLKPGLVLVAGDVSEQIGGKIALLAGVHTVPVRTVLTKDDFGAILGKAPRSAVAIKPGGFVQQLLKAVDRYRNFLGEV